MDPVRQALAMPALAAALAAQAPDPCAGIEDAAERVECYVRQQQAPPEQRWRIGESTDPITDRDSVVLRRLAEEAFEGPEGEPLRPALTLVCYHGRETLLSLEAGEPLAGRADGTPAGVRLTARIGADPPAARTWTASAPDYAAAYLDEPSGALILARALAEEDPGEALFRYGAASGATRTARFGLQGLAALLPRLERACAPRY